MVCFILAGMTATSSCSSNEEKWMQDSADNVLKIETAIADTRAVVTGTEFQHGDDIGVFLKTINGSDYSFDSAPGNNIRYRFGDGNQWSSERNIILTDDELNLYAYYPYNTSTKSSGTAIDIDISPTTEDGQPDYMYGSVNGVNENQSTAKILFKHALARVTLAITKESTDVGDGKISSIRMENDTLFQVSGTVTENIGRGTELSVKGSLDMKDGTINRTTNPDDFILIPVNSTINEKATYIEFLVMPCGAATPPTLPENQKGGGISVVIYIDGFKYKVELGYPHWEAGEQYTYPIAINRETKLEINFNGHEGVDMGTLSDLGNKMYWATTNMGADAVEDYGELYYWGDPVMDKNFNYNLDIDLLLYGYSSPYWYSSRPDNISGTKYDIARTQWGSKWRIPTTNEWIQLGNNSTAEFVTINDISGYVVTSTINGNSIFLPAAGYQRWVKEPFSREELRHYDKAKGAYYMLSTQDVHYAYYTEYDKSWRIVEYYWAYAYILPIRPVISE